MKVFHKGDYRKASDLLGAFLDKFDSENELVDRAKIYLKTCDRLLKNEKMALNSFDDYYQDGMIKVNSGEYEEALKMLDQAQALRPNEGKVFFLLSSVYCLLDQPEKCLENLARAVALDSHFAILAQNEEDFNSLKDDEKFKRVTRME